MTLAAIAEAETAGARLKPACAVVGISARTVQRWRSNPDVQDRRCGPKHRPPNALSPAEEAKVVGVMTSPQNAGISPKQLVPQLADQGVYLASESTMYRLQRRCGLRKRRRHASRTHVTRSTTVHCATGPNQVWSWDITWLPTVVRGSFFKLYLVLDVWSRRIVGWDVHTTETADHAAALIQRIADDSGVDLQGLVLHADNGKPMRGSTMLATLQWLGVVPSFSRPHVSNDNPYSEALFRTLKHTPAYPKLPFASLEAARRWVARFVDWYNGEHRHSAIRYVTPDERHFGQEQAILARRQQVYERARRRNPQRWSGSTRDWTPVGEVQLNPPSPKQLQEAA
jgi:transposase InsO family protein